MTLKNEIENIIGSFYEIDEDEEGSILSCESISLMATKIVELFKAKCDEAVREAQPKWIMVKDQRPPLDVDVWTVEAFDAVEDAKVKRLNSHYEDPICWTNKHGEVVEFEDVTHWMPIPPFKP